MPEKNLLDDISHLCIDDIFSPNVSELLIQMEQHTLWCY